MSLSKPSKNIPVHLPPKTSAVAAKTELLQSVLTSPTDHSEAIPDHPTRPHRKRSRVLDALHDVEGRKRLFDAAIAESIEDSPPFVQPSPSVEEAPTPLIEDAPTQVIEEDFINDVFGAPTDHIELVALSFLPIILPEKYIIRYLSLSRTGVKADIISIGTTHITSRSGEKSLYLVALSNTCTRSWDVDAECPTGPLLPIVYVLRRQPRTCYPAKPIHFYTPELRLGEFPSFINTLDGPVDPSGYVIKHLQWGFDPLCKVLSIQKYLNSVNQEILIAITDRTSFPFDKQTRTYSSTALPLAYELTNIVKTEFLAVPNKK